MTTPFRTRPDDGPQLSASEAVHDAIHQMVRQFADPMAFLRELVQNGLDAGAMYTQAVFTDAQHGFLVCAAADDALARWCPHVEVPLSLEVRGLGDADRSARVDRPLAGDGDASLTHRAAGVTYALRVSPRDASAAFYNRGLLLHACGEALDERGARARDACVEAVIARHALEAGEGAQPRRLERHLAPDLRGACGLDAEGASLDPGDELDLAGAEERTRRDRELAAGALRVAEGAAEGRVAHGRDGLADGVREEARVPRLRLLRALHGDGGRLHRERAQEGREGGAVVARPAKMPSPGMRIHVREAFGVAVMREWFRAAPAETDLLRERVVALPVPLTRNGVALAPRDARPPIASVPLALSGDLRGALHLVDAQHPSANTLVFCERGVALEVVALREPDAARPPLPLRMIVDADALPTNAARSRVTLSAGLRGATRRAWQEGVAALVEAPAREEHQAREHGRGEARDVALITRAVLGAEAPA